jgi:hypothetical protein
MIVVGTIPIRLAIHDRRGRGVAPPGVRKAFAVEALVKFGFLHYWEV